MADVYATGKKAGQPKPNRIGGKGICVECGAASYGIKCRPCMHRATECICIGCGNKFSRNRRGKDERKYCSRECAFKDIAKWKTKVRPQPGRRESTALPYSKVWFRSCADCGITFVARRLKQFSCCRSCLYQYWLRRGRDEYVPTATSIRKCVTCGVDYSSNRTTSRYCSDACVPRRNNARDRARHAGVAYEIVNIMRVFERDGWRCQVCGKNTRQSRRGTRYSNAPEIDHRVAMARGGGHTYDNVQCACRSCNAWKSHNYTVGQFPLFNASVK